MNTKIDWTAPLELSDGTPVVLRPADQGDNPDSDGDYYVRREDGKRFTVAQYGHVSMTFIAKPDGSEWRPADNSPGLTVRNRKTLLLLIGASGNTYPATLVSDVDGIIVAREPSGATYAFWSNTGERVNGDKAVRLKVKPVETVTYRTFGDDGLGGFIEDTCHGALRLVTTHGSRSHLGVLKFTEVDGKITNIEVAHVA